MAAGTRTGAGVLSLILIAGSIVLLFFVVLSGVKHVAPLKSTYFLYADTGNIAGSRARSQWTYFYICGEGNNDCGSPVPALPVGAAWASGAGGVPSGLAGSHYKGTTSTYYYYLWRFGWVFYLMALIFDVFAFFTALLAPCSRLASGAAGATLAFALFWMTLAASLMTVVFVKMRNEFRNVGIQSQVGSYAFGFTWGAWAAMFLATMMLFFGVCFGGSNRNSTVTRRNSQSGFFRRQRRQSVRHSFVDNDSSRRVKDDYA